MDDDDAERRDARRRFYRAGVKLDSKRRRAASKAATAKRKKVKEMQAQLPRRQAKSLAALKEFEAVPNPGSEAPSVQTVHDSSSGCRGAAPALAGGRSQIVPWRDAGDLAQLTMACRAVAAIGGVHARVFTLLMSPDVQYRAKRDPKWMRRRIVLAVGADTPLVMSLGYAPSGVLHIHGALVLRGAIAVAPDDLPRITARLEAACGQWAASHGGEHQLVLESFEEAAQRLGKSLADTIDGWAA